MANSIDPDQTAPSGAAWSGSILFAYDILSATLVCKILGHLSYFYAVAYTVHSRYLKLYYTFIL